MKTTTKRVLAPVLFAVLAVFIVSVPGEAFLGSLAQSLITGAITSGAEEAALNTPSVAFLSMLQSVQMATGIDIDGHTAKKLWVATERPKVGSPYRMAQAYKRIMKACGVKDFDVATVKDTDQVMLDPGVLKNAFSQGVVMVAFLSDNTYENRRSAQNTSNYLWRAGWNTGLYSAFNIGSQLARAEGYKNCENAVAVVGMCGNDPVIVGDKGKLMSIPLEDLEMCEFVVAIMSTRQVDTSNLNVQSAAEVTNEGSLEETQGRETKVSAESEDYIEKMRKELKEKGKM